MNHGPIAPMEIAPEPNRSADERDTLVEFIEYFRSVLIRKAVGLTSRQMNQRVGASTLTIGGLLKHSALVEDHWFEHTWLGRDAPEPWAAVDWEVTPDWDFDSAPDNEPVELLVLFEKSVARSRAAITDSYDLDALAPIESRLGQTSLRWILVHIIEEYARHCGHADLIRESIDGQTGD